MIQDFVKIRKGTNPRTALNKIMIQAHEYILYNSKRLKTEKTIHVNFSGGDTA